MVIQRGVTLFLPLFLRQSNEGKKGKARLGGDQGPVLRRPAYGRRGFFLFLKEQMYLRDCVSGKAEEIMSSVLNKSSYYIRGGGRVKEMGLTEGEDVGG